MCMFCRSLFVLLSLFFWPLFCLSCDLWYIHTLLLKTIKINILEEFSDYCLWPSNFFLSVLCFLFVCLFLFLLLLCLSSSCVLWVICYQCLWIVHSWLPLRFSLTFFWLPLRFSLTFIYSYSLIMYMLSGERNKYFFYSVWRERGSTLQSSSPKTCTLSFNNPPIN